ncbi:MAG TPA: enoyl-CoA hydratase-related protein [Thermoanaerobaculia bacterium]|nr:enoyl-CoA hydratase-related protein [Thermoanaerobaculia bacterium]
MPESPHLRLARDGRAATLEIDRPPLNILDAALLAELETLLAALADPAPQVLVVRGAGERAFSAGVAVEDHVRERVEASVRSFHRVLLALRRLPSVTVAVVHGHCLGGGMELAAACDLVVAASDARFGQPEIHLGCFPPWAAAHYPRLLGPKVAAELLLTGRPVSAEEAHRLGLVNRLAPAGELDRVADELLGEVLAQSAAATPLVKRALAAGEDEAAFERALAESERLYFEELVRTEDMEEGIEAFLAKRAPRWRHR